MIRIALILCCATTASAAADDGVRLEVAVGETVERDVGFAMGLLCDDLAIVHADLHAATPESNTFRVTGVAEGTTRCRVGTAPNRPAYVFEIHVIPARHRHQLDRRVALQTQAFGHSGRACALRRRSNRPARPLPYPGPRR